MERLTAENWTKDADGNPVNWLEPQFSNPPYLRLQLPGEKYHQLDLVVRQRRIREYYALLGRTSGNVERAREEVAKLRRELLK